MHEHTVALMNAARGKRPGSALHARSDFRPAPLPIVPDEARTIGEPPCRLQQQRGEIAGWDQRTASRIET